MLSRSLCTRGLGPGAAAVGPRAVSGHLDRAAALLGFSTCIQFGGFRMIGGTLW